MIQKIDHKKLNRGLWITLYVSLALCIIIGIINYNVTADEPIIGKHPFKVFYDYAMYTLYIIICLCGKGFDYLDNLDKKNKK